MSIAPIPLSQCDLGRYIAYLSRKLCFTSIRQYLNVVRILHVEAGLPNPLENNWYVSSILKGVRRVKGDASQQKLPITLDILRKIFSQLDLHCSLDRVFWAACLVAFYSFFRKSNLLIPSIDVFDPNKHLCASDASFTPEGVVLSVRWSKVIQFRERTLQIPLPRIPNSAFCPSNAILGMLLECPKIKDPVPLFQYVENSSCLPLTQAVFSKRLHDVLMRSGFPSKRYSNHSFRRGGASFALSCSLPVDLIKLQGDWKSNACERYLEHSYGLRRQVAFTLGESTSTFFSGTWHWGKSQMTELKLTSLCLCNWINFLFLFFMFSFSYIHPYFLPNLSGTMEVFWKILDLLHHFAEWWIWHAYVHFLFCSNFCQDFSNTWFMVPKRFSSLFLLQCSVCLVANGRYTPNTYQLLLSYISEQFNREIRI